MYPKWRKYTFFGVLAGLLILMAFVIYSSNKVAYTTSPGTMPLEIALVGSIDTLNPALLNAPEERILASTLYEGLVSFDEDSQSVKPLLAKDWKYAADGENIVINLNRDVKFSNGKELKAGDVKACWENTFFTSKEWSTVSLFLSITGANERLEGKADQIAGIEVINDRTLRVRFAKPNAAFIYMLCSPAFWVYDISDPVSPSPGTGPFVLKNNQDNKDFTLTRNEKYHRGIPHISSIHARVFIDPYEAFGEYKDGKLDYLDSVPLRELENVKNNQEWKELLIEKPVARTYFLGFNLNKEPFAGNYQLRRALNYAIDRDLIIKEILGGAYRAANGIIPLGVAGYQRDMRGYSYDPQKAQLLMEEAGYPLGEGLPPLTLTYNNDAGHQLVIESIAAQLAEIGIKVQPQGMDWDYYKKQLANMNMSFFRVEWSADYPDPDSFLYSMFHSSNIGIGNYFAYHNDQVDKILDASREEVKSSKERIKLIKRAEEIIVDDAPCLWLFQSSTARMTGSNVKGLAVNSINMIDWYQVRFIKPAAQNDGLTPQEDEV